MSGVLSSEYSVANNLPIVRQGTTATMAHLKYNGKNEFLIDIATFNGSSGSPIFYYRDLYTRKNYVAAVNPKLYLLGILYAGPTVNADGKIYKANPTEIEAGGYLTRTKIPMNLGYVIRSNELLEFKEVFQNLLGKN
jgi:hypothetical protein